jgi:hypothetical protein
MSDIISRRNRVQPTYRVVHDDSVTRTGTGDDGYMPNESIFMAYGSKSKEPEVRVILPKLVAEYR